MREYLPCSTANNEFPLRGNFGGRRGRETRLFAKRKCRALLVYKQSYGCFEMVLFPAKTGDLKVYLHSKNFKLHPFALYDGKIRYLIPPAALNLERFASSARKRNGTVEIFSFSEQPQNSVRTSLVPLSICLREIRACGASKTLRRQHCGVAPTPTWLHENFGASRLHTNQITYFY